MDDEEKIEKYSERGYSERLILLSIGSQKSPETILDYAKQLKEILN